MEPDQVSSGNAEKNNQGAGSETPRPALERCPHCHTAYVEGSNDTCPNVCYAPGDEGAEFCGDPKAMHCSVLGDAITHEHLVKCMRDDHLIHHPFVGAK